MPHPENNSQKGNALWFILIVIALFGALTAALSRNTGTVNQSGNIEQSRVRATSILRYTTALQTAIQRMMLEGLSESELSFETADNDYKNTSCTHDKCKLFKTAGGGIPYRDLSSILGNDNTQDWIISAQNRLYLAGCNDEDNTCTDLLIIAPNIPKGVCMQINAIQGISNTNNTPPQMDKLLIDKTFDGSFPMEINNLSIGTNNANQASQTQGKTAACIESSGIYYFYQLLIAR